MTDPALNVDPVRTVDLNKGDDVYCYHGPLLYAARISDQRVNKAGKLQYLVHYFGWKKVYDEWIDATSPRIVLPDAKNLKNLADRIVPVRPVPNAGKTVFAKLDGEHSTSAGVGRPRKYKKKTDRPAAATDAAADADPPRRRRGRPAKVKPPNMSLPDVPKPESPLFPKNKAFLQLVRQYRKKAAAAKTTPSASASAAPPTPLPPPPPPQPPRPEPTALPVDVLDRMFGRSLHVVAELDGGGLPTPPPPLGDETSSNDGSRRPSFATAKAAAGLVTSPSSSSSSSPSSSSSDESSAEDGDDGREERSMFPDSIPCPKKGTPDVSGVPSPSKDDPLPLRLRPISFEPAPLKEKKAATMTTKKQRKLRPYLHWKTVERLKKLERNGHGVSNNVGGGGGGGGGRGVSDVDDFDEDEKINIEEEDEDEVDDDDDGDGEQEEGAARFPVKGRRSRRPSVSSSVSSVSPSKLRDDGEVVDGARGRSRQADGAKPSPSRKKVDEDVDIRVRIDVPPNLAAILVRDQRACLAVEKVEFKPCVTIDEIFGRYLDQKTDLNIAKFRALESVISTISDMFQLLLPNRLLYRSEKAAHRELMERSSKPLVELYGGVHLLRMLCSEIGNLIGRCMKARTMDERRATLTMHYVYDIVDFMRLKVPFWYEGVHDDDEDDDEEEDEEQEEEEEEEEEDDDCATAADDDDGGARRGGGYGYEDVDFVSRPNSNAVSTPPLELDGQSVCSEDVLVDAASFEFVVGGEEVVGAENVAFAGDHDFVTGIFFCSPSPESDRKDFG